MAENKF